jgi:hypothetical protein
MFFLSDKSGFTVESENNNYILEFNRARLPNGTLVFSLFHKNYYLHISTLEKYDQCPELQKYCMELN